MLFNGIIIQNITDEAYDEYDDYDVGMNINQLNAALLKRGIKPSAKFTEKFHELDTNKNGLLEKSEAEAAEQDYGAGTVIGSILGVLGSLGSLLAFG